MSTKSTNIFKSFFNIDKSTKKVSDKKSNGMWKSFKTNIQLFAKALLGPITLLAFGGLLLGIGSVITKYTVPDSTGYMFANIIKNTGNIVFTLLPLLFAMAIASAYTNNSGTAILTAVVAYIALLALTGAQFVGTKDATGHADGFSWFNAIKFKTENGASVISTTLGFQTLDVSVFGGFIAGPLAAWAFNKFKDQRMPVFLSMFQGHRLVPIIGILIIVPLSFIVALIWPWISYAFVKFGQASGKMGGGADSLLFGIFERALLPTGLHHMFYSPLLYTSAGATVSGDYQIASSVIVDGHTFAAGTHLFEIDASPFVKSASSVVDSMPNVKGLQVDVATWQALDIKEKVVLYGDRTAFQSLNGSMIQFGWIANLMDGASVHLGRFSAGKFPLMVFWIPAAGAAMIMAAPKEKRKLVMGVVGAATLTSFLTGITEPFEYTFLFAAPVLYFGFHIWMAGLAYLTANVAGVYYGPTFGGVIDYIIYGIVPQATGQSTNVWWLLAIGGAGAPIYYFVFTWAIKKFNLMTPGRDGGEVKMTTKADYQAAKGEGAAGGDKLEYKAQIMYKALGGRDNLEKVTNCASRLRVIVKDPSKVDYDLAQQAQPFGVVGKGKDSQQYVFGPNVTIITEKVLELVAGTLKENLDLTPAVAEVKSEETKEVTATKQLINIYAPTKGEIKKLSDCSDDVFAQEMMGKGVLIVPESGEFRAPMDGELSMVFPTNHAFSVTNSNGDSILIHIGMDTVKLDGKGFTLHKNVGDKVKTGDLIITADLEAIKPQVPSIETPIILTSDSKGVFANEKLGKVSSSKDIIFNIKI